MTTQEQLSEAEAQRWYEVGISSGLDQAAIHLKAASNEHFAREQDSEAMLLRDLAKYLKAQSEERHPGPRKSQTEEPTG